MSVQKLQSLEMLRAVAALLVVMFHTQWIFGTHTGTSPFAGMFVGGYRGVDLFFVLSGFIIARVHTADIGRPRRLGNYVFNRIARVYPAVWIMTACAGGLYAAGFGGALKTGKLTAWGIAASALLLPQIGAPLVNVTWTLKYEVFFYLVFGVMIMDLRVGLAFLGAWQLAVLSASPWFPQGVPLPGGFYLRSICLEFSVGLACAWLLGRPRFVMALHCAVAQRAVLAVGIAIFVGGMWAQVELDRGRNRLCARRRCCYCRADTTRAVRPHSRATRAGATGGRFLCHLPRAFFYHYSAGHGAGPRPCRAEERRGVPHGGRVRRYRRTGIPPAGGSADPAPAATEAEADAGISNRGWRRPRCRKKPLPGTCFSARAA